MFQSKKMKYEYIKLPFNNPLVPIYFIIKYKGCCCQLNQLLQQVLYSAYGFGPDLVQITGYKRKMLIFNHAIPVVNSKDAFIIQAMCGQPKIKQAIAFIKKLNDVSGLSVEKLVQFGGKQLKSSDITIAAKGSNLSDPKPCSCSEDFKEEKTFQISSKKEQLMFYMFQQGQGCCVDISGAKVHVKSYDKIKTPTKAQHKRFITQLEKAWPGHDSTLWKWQGLACGFFF